MSRSLGLGPARARLARLTGVLTGAVLVPSFRIFVYSIHFSAVIDSVRERGVGQIGNGFGKYFVLFCFSLFFSDQVSDLAIDFLFSSIDEPSFPRRREREEDRSLQVDFPSFLFDRTSAALHTRVMYRTF